ncbi:hypothetical protein DST30_12235 [Salmonella enterica subsp. enterica serovar Panama]|nr:hypothetical protein [Salmonella enterica subsp. enterica serovar Panama]
MGTKMSELGARMTAWYARKDNPNQVTAAQLDAPDKNAIDARIAQKLPKGVLPVAYFGDCTDTRTDRISGVTTSGTTISFPAIPVMIAGTDYTLAKGTLDIKSLTSDWANKTGYLFIHQKGGSVSWSWNSSAGVDTSTAIRVGQVSCNASGITSVVLNKVFILGQKRYMG